MGSTTSSTLLLIYEFKGSEGVVLILTYMNKIFKIVIQFKNLVQNIDRNSDKITNTTNLTDFGLHCILFIKSYAYFF